MTQTVSQTSPAPAGKGDSTSRASARATAAARAAASGRAQSYGAGHKMAASVGSAVKTNYRGASQTSQELLAFRAPSLSADTANRYERQIILNRVRDLVRNEALASTAVRKSTGMVIGSGWRLQARPDAYALGITSDQASDLGSQIEREFKRWATNPLRMNDAQRRHDFGGQLRLMYNERKVSNDLLAVMIRRDHPGCYSTGVQLIDPDRLSNPFGRIDDDTLRSGIEIDGYGAAQAYHIRRAHPSDYSTRADSFVWDRVPARHTTGRPVVIHSFLQQRAEETRGLSLFAPLVEKFVMRGQHEKSELQAAILSAVFATFVQSGFDPGAVAEMLGVDGNYGDKVGSFQDKRMDFYGANPVTIDGATIPVVMPGDSITSVSAGRAAGPFEKFNKILSQNIAAQLGVHEGQITGDYGGLNYSTLRGAYNEIYKDVMVERADFGGQVVQPIFLCVLDEAIQRGRIDIPDGAASLFDEPAAWTQSNWIGPSRGHIDSEKEAKGNLLALEGGWASLTEIAAAEGKDIEDIIVSRKEFIALCEKHGVNPDDFDPRDAALGATQPGPNPTSES